jgi:tetratricopeptide (TPR) repeat protein
MKFKPYGLPVVVLLLSLAAAYAQTSDAELRVGIAAYKDSHYDEAIAHFQKAVDLDSGSINARMYLATACLSEFIPGVLTEENTAVAQRAVEQYQYVVNSDAAPEQKVNAAKGTGYIYLNLKKFEEAKTYYRMASDFDPKDPEPFYSVGVIDWTLCYQPRMEARAKLGIKPGDNLDGKKPSQMKVCDELKAENTLLIAEGIETLNKAIQLRPDYDDAMAYMNLMYRERADIECDDPAARAKDLKAADDWVDKTLATKKAKAKESDRTSQPTAPSPR